MAAPVDRDIARTRNDLARWLAERLAGTGEIEIKALSTPQAGVSSDTLFLDAQIREPGRAREVRWVVRIQASSIQVYQDPNIEKQFRVMDALGRSTDVPVPRMLWLEPDPALLGAPFFVMERVEGRVPSSYNASGWLADLPPARRERLWLDAIGKLARLHKTSLAVVRFLDRPDLGATGLDQEIVTWDRYFEWSKIPAHPTLTRAQRWLKDHEPANRPTGLAWGDAQFGNMIFDDEGCVALIDWETVSLGGAEEDLSWWLLFDEFYSTMMGLRRLPGLGDRDATLMAWEQFAGRKLEAMEWHDVFANWRLALISERTIRLYAAAGHPLPDIAPGDGNPCIARLARLLAER